MSDQKTVPGRKFYVVVAGKTHGAHQDMVDALQHSSQVNVDSFEFCDYQVLFCPISSRVETDISEALSKVQVGKPVILVVMHHTFDPERIVAESRRQVHNTNVLLTVDFLFHDGKFLKSNRNDISWHETEKVLGVPVYPPSRRFNKWKYIVGAVVIIGVGASVVLIALAVDHIL